ncbi:D-amino-acid dehydrogenase [Murinocardiopsis flavida]|uniref:D-amino-acid dehydrogenase n=1 Tax=Murinocardiopsis flavida TaxID=645275 RepID=A0A2P8D9D4_9ACTN|nr:FAD-dependent oxidoreductase [Murinocardiopsis flavida]PSK93791.1 D-amino-acid dehydrogenase [Murinocardiopsis flavida]
MAMGRMDGGPASAVVVGAGVVGLSTAWFLQERGVEVTVLDRRGVAAGASWGNAGWLSPGLSIPLPEPSVLRYGLRSLVSPSAPLYVPMSPDIGLWSFLARFATHCTMGAWKRGMRGYLPVNSECLDAFDTLTRNGVESPTHEAPITAAFAKREQAKDLRHELSLIAEAGQDVRFTELTGDEARAAVPQIAGGVQTAIRLEGQRYVDPGAFVASLAASVRERGGVIEEDFEVARLRPDGGGAAAEAADGRRVTADAVVLATGTWLPGLARPLGVRTQVRAGRGYSFTVPTDAPVPGPVYLPAVRVACTPYQGKLRVAGTMEFRRAEAPLDPKRIDAVVRSARPLLSGVDWDQRSDEWVGSRPVSTNGLPLIGATKARGVYVAGGHGMWGLTLGPVTGRLLAEQITTGKQPEQLRPFSPTR